MTSPGDGNSGFEYTDDSVIARVSFDIPAAAVTDISQITQVMGAMRTQLEAVSRAQSDWLDYLSEVPQIAERANQAFRDQITLMERMSYLQSEIGQAGRGAGADIGYGGGGGAGGVGGRSGGVGDGTGASSYSTAAPTGYTPHWGRNDPGMGTGTNINAAMAQVANLAEDDRASGEMLAARGMAVNPATLGIAGGAIMGALGVGTTGTSGQATNPGSQTNQPSQSNRNAASPPNPSNGGTPSGNPSPNTPNPGGPNASPDQGFISRMFSELSNFGSGTRIGTILSGIPTMLSNVLGGPSGPGASPGPGGGPGMFQRGAGMLGTAAKNIWQATSPAGRVAAATGLGAIAFNKSQQIGERITEYQQLGSEQGGDYATGFKEDIEARFQALDPFINTAQAREATRMPMSAGFSGDSRDELRDLLINNFKDLGVTMADSMKMSMADMRGRELTDENVKEARTSSEAFVNVLKEMSGDGENSMALQQRVQQAVEMKTAMASMGIDQESAQRSIIGVQQGYGDSMALRGDMSRISAQTMGSGTLMTMVANRLGVTGILPAALPSVLADMGIDQDEAMEMAYVEAAKMVSGLNPEPNRIAAFQGLLADQGVELDYSQAKDLYRKVTGKKSERPTAKANSRAKELGEKNKQTNWNPITGIADTLAPIMNARSVEDFKNLPRDVLDGFMGRHSPSGNAEKVEDSFQRAGRIPDDQFAPSGRKARPLPESMNQAPQTVSTSGRVQGEVRITVDQQGRVSAPPVIQLSGTQRSVNSGYGSATLNNPPPGESRGINTFPGGQ